MFENQSQIQSTEQQKQPKNFQTASIIDRGQQQNVAIIKHYKFYRTKHANTKKLWRTVENTTGHQFDPVGNATNLSNKTFTK